MIRVAATEVCLTTGYADFVSVKVKGPGPRYYCDLCKPADRPQGQAMTLAAALRHEKENRKHLGLVAAAREDEWGYAPECDWGPTPLPKGTTAWEYSSYADTERVEEFIRFWMDNVARVERGEELVTMDTFIDRYNQQYEEWAEGVKKEMAAHGSGQVLEEEVGEAQDAEAEAEWDGVKGCWYTGGSFDPCEDGLHSRGLLPPPVPRSPESIQEQIDEYAKKYFGIGVEEDPYEAWGVSRDEITPWTNVPAPAPDSDVTPQDAIPSQSARSPSKKRPKAKKAKGQTGVQSQPRGGGQKKGKIVNGRLPDAHRV